jgi:protein O-mannosyl-transferase
MSATPNSSQNKGGAHGISTEPQASQAKRRWISLLLLVVVLGVFLSCLRNGFISFDDGTYVTANSQVQSGLTWKTVAWAFRSSDASNWHPLTWLSHALDCQVFGLKPWGHHLTNVALHALNTLLLFLILERMTSATWRSALVAVLFGLHPLHVESVAWVAERKDVLSAFFFLLTLAAYVRWVENGREKSGERREGGQGSGEQGAGKEQKAESRKQKKERAAEGDARAFSTLSYLPSSIFYLGSLLCFALGLMSKPMLVTLPFVLLLLDYWPLQRFPIENQKSKIKNLLSEKLPFFLLAAVSSAVTYLVQQRAGATAMLGPLPWTLRVENAIVACCRYLAKLFWPLDLSVFYPYRGHWPGSTVWCASASLLGICLWVWRWRKPAPFLLAGWLWFVGTLVPVLGLVQVGRQSLADRYTYIPSIGMFLFVVWGAHALLRRGRRQVPRSAVVAQSAVAAMVLVFCSALTVRQISYWRTSESLFQHALDLDPNNFMAHGQLAVAFEQQGRFGEARSQYEAVLRLQPEDVNARNLLGSLLLRMDRTEDAIRQFQEAVKSRPEFAEAHNNLAYVYRGQGRLAEAAREYQEAVRLNPADFRIRLNLAAVMLSQGQGDEAIRQLQEAVRLNPDDATTRIDFGSLLFNAGHIDEAFAQFAEAVRCEPASAEAHFGLGSALARKARNEEAREQFVQALKLRPDYPEAQQQLQVLGK